MQSLAGIVVEIVGLETGSRSRRPPVSAGTGITEGTGVVIASGNGRKLSHIRCDIRTRIPPVKSFCSSRVRKSPAGWADVLKSICRVGRTYNSTGRGCGIVVVYAVVSGQASW